MEGLLFPQVLFEMAPFKYKIESQWDEIFILKVGMTFFKAM